MNRLKIILLIVEICLAAVLFRQSPAQILQDSQTAGQPAEGEPAAAQDPPAIAAGTVRAPGPFRWEDYTTIAHAMGGLDGFTYLNCPEGFRNAYEKGCRLFEVDLTKTRDGVWVCRHSWSEAYGQWEEDGKRHRLTLEEFLNAPVYGRYTPMTFQDLLLMLRDYPDAYVLLDSKHYTFRNYQSTLQDYADLAVLAGEIDAQDMLARMIPEIYSEAMLTGIVQIYDFPQYMYSLYKDYSQEELEETARFCGENEIGAVTVSREYWTPELQEIFQQKGMRVYVYTVNDQVEAAGLNRIGFDGIVTDVLFSGR